MNHVREKNKGAAGGGRTTDHAFSLFFKRLLTRKSEKSEKIGKIGKHIRRSNATDLERVDHMDSD